MEWPTAEIRLKGAAGEESLAHEWPVKQLERLGPFLQFADVFAAVSRLQFGGIAKEAPEGGMT